MLDVSPGLWHEHGMKYRINAAMIRSTERTDEGLMMSIMNDEKKKKLCRVSMGEQGEAVRNRVQREGENNK